MQKLVAIKMCQHWQSDNMHCHIEHAQSHREHWLPSMKPTTLHGKTDIFLSIVEFVISTEQPDVKNHSTKADLLI